MMTGDAGRRVREVLKEFHNCPEQVNRDAE
jgi:hypothetical protein